MAVGTPALLGQNSAVDSAADLTVTLSGAITAGNMAFAVVLLTRNDDTAVSASTSVTGGGVTWTLHRTYYYDAASAGRARLEVYRAYASAPSGTAIVLDVADTLSGYAMAVFEVAGCDTGGSNGANAVHATNIGEATGTANLVEVAMLTLASANNAYLAIGAYRATSSRTWTPDAAPAFTEILDYVSAISASLHYTSLEISYRLAGGDTNPTVGATTSGAINTNAILVLELVAAAAAGSPDNHASTRGIARGFARGFA